MTDGPNRLRVMADGALARRQELEADLKAARGEAARKAVRARISLVRDVEAFIRSRAGYR